MTLTRFDQKLDKLSSLSKPPLPPVAVSSMGSSVDDQVI